MFDTYMVEWYYINRSATDRRLALKFDSYKSNRQRFLRTWRLFLCLFIAFGTNCVSKRKACNTQAKDGYEQIGCQHNTIPPFIRFLRTDFYVIRGHSPLLEGPTAYRVW